MALSLIQIGLGPIGLGVTKQIIRRPDLMVSGAVDIDEKKIGRKLSEIYLQYYPDEKSIADKIPDVTVCQTVGDALSSSDIKPTIAIHTTSSFLSVETPNLLEIIQSGLHVVSTTEELAYPWWHHPKEAEEIDEAAKKAGVTVFGTGVNPGFVMDLLPVCLTGISAFVDTIEVERIVDAGTRRGPLKRKVGAGMTVDEFKKRQAEGTFGHIGLVESVAMIASALGWELKDISSDLNPKVADLTYQSDDVTVETGNVLGIDQIATGVDAAGNEKIKLHLQMYVGAVNPHDEITISGNPSLKVIVSNGVPGDIATISAAINGVSLISKLTPGLKTAIDIPVPRWKSYYVET